MQLRINFRAPLVSIFVLSRKHKLIISHIKLEFCKMAAPSNTSSLNELYVNRSFYLLSGKHKKFKTNEGFMQKGGGSKRYTLLQYKTSNWK